MERFPGRDLIQSVLRFHFVYRHVWYTIVVLEDGNHPLPQFLRFNVFSPCKALNGRHSSNVM